MADDKQYWTYELDKPMLGRFAGKTVGIRPSWIRRCQRYAGATGLNIRSVYRFINNGLIDRTKEGFNDEGLDGALSDAQKWVLMYLFLKTGVPEYIQNPDIDEELPSLINAEPEAEKSVIGKVTGTVAGTVASASSAVTTPVKSLTDMVTGKKTTTDEETNEKKDGE